MKLPLLTHNLFRPALRVALGILLILFTVRLPAQTITTVAGSALKGDGGPATSANLNTPTGVAVDGAGNLFIADPNNHRIRKVAPNGTITTVAGNGTFGFSGDNGPATSANLANPTGVAVDGSGNLFIADLNNQRIRKVAIDGTITTVANNLDHPFGVAVDGAGNLFIADQGHYTIRKVATNNTITIVAGTGTSGFSGDGGLATSATLGNPVGVAVDGAGNLFIADQGNNRIRKVATDGTITTIAGNGTSGSGGDGGPATSANLAGPFGVSVDGAGNLFIADQYNNRIRRVATDGTITTIAGNGSSGFSGDNSPATSANLNGPTGVGIDSNGNLFIADQYNNRIRKVAIDGTITTVAGNGTTDFGGDNGPATSATLGNPTSVALDGSGNLFIADLNNQRIRKVAPNGTITTVAGNGNYGFSGDNGPATSASLANPAGVAMDGAGNLFIADRGNHLIRKVASNGIITTIAGTGTNGFSGDTGPATSASLAYPNGVAVDGAGNLFIADQYNNRIRKVATNGTITTVAGNGSFGFSGDNGPATSAALSNPYSVVVDGSGNLFIADAGNYRIRKVDTNGTITTVAGNGTSSFGGDTGPATSAALNFPASIAVDGAGTLFIADQFNQRIRKVAPDGSITTVAGNGTSGFSGDGGPATSASLSTPTGVAVDGSGNLFIADQYNNRIRRVILPPSVYVSPATPAAICAGSGFSLTAITTGFTPASYSWSSQPAGLSASGATPNFTAPSVSNPTTYTLTVTATDGMVSPTASVTLTVNPQPAISVSSTSALVGSVISLSATGGTAYQWTSSSGATLSNPATSSVVSATLNSPGNQLFTVLVTNSACSQSLSVSVAASYQTVDLMPTILVDNLNFSSAQVGVTRDFIVNINEVSNQPSGGTIAFKIAKLTAFDITYATSNGTSQVLGGIANTNGSWSFSEDLTYITVQTSAAFPAFGSKIVGFSIARKAGIPVNTIQSINITILPNAGNEQNFGNNIAITSVTAN